MPLGGGGVSVGAPLVQTKKEDKSNNGHFCLANAQLVKTVHLPK